MTREGAADLLAVAKHVMPWIEADAAERYEIKLRCGLSIEEAHRLADLVLPRGRRGRIRLILYPPASARALVFIATVLRAIEE